MINQKQISNGISPQVYVHNYLADVSKNELASDVPKKAGGKGSKQLKFQLSDQSKVLYQTNGAIRVQINELKSITDKDSTFVLLKANH
jgi:hypothetical protein